MKYAALVSEKKVADPSCRGSASGEMKAIQNSVSRGWASGTRRDPHPSTSGTVHGPYEHVLPRAAALDEVLRLGQRKGVFFLPKRLCREVHLEQLSTLGWSHWAVTPNIVRDVSGRPQRPLGVPLSRIELH